MGGRDASAAALCVAFAMGACGGKVVFDGQGAGGAGAATGTATGSGPGTGSGSTQSTGSLATTGGSMSTGSGASAECAGYCEALQGSCIDELTQYPSVEICLSTCASYALGSAGDTAGNTVGCRAYHAAAAELAPSVHCVHAGPYGGSVCGAPCESFCTLVLQACTGTDTVYIDQAACMKECQSFPDTGGFDASMTTGDTLSCRLYHATLATGDDDVHCPHVTAASATCQ